MKDGGLVLMDSPVVLPIMPGVAAVLLSCRNMCAEMCIRDRDIMDRYNFRAKVDFKVADWLTFGNNTSALYYTYKRPSSFYSWLFNRINDTCLLYTSLRAFPFSVLLGRGASNFNSCREE